MDMKKASEQLIDVCSDIDECRIMLAEAEQRKRELLGILLGTLPANEANATAAKDEPAKPAKRKGRGRGRTKVTKPEVLEFVRRNGASRSATIAAHFRANQGSVAHHLTYWVRRGLLQKMSNGTYRAAIRAVGGE